MSPRTIALVLETNNLRGGADDELHEDRVVASLERLLRHLTHQTLSLKALHEVVITHDGLDAGQRGSLETAAGRPLTFVLVGEDTGYYDAKNRGFDATSADVVVFADADCWPDRSWLERLTGPLLREDASVTAGRTTYRDDVLGQAATTIDFMYFAGARGEAPPRESFFARPSRPTRNFYANNVAFSRDVFERRRFEPAPGIYRGHCQLLGMKLAEDGIPIQYVFDAHTVHRFPDSLAELLRLRLLRGADTAEMAPHIAASALPARWSFLGRLGPASALAVLGVRFGLSLRALNRQGLTRAEGPKRALAIATVAGLSAADAAGAIARSVGRADLGVKDGALVRGALSYHADKDDLARRVPASPPRRSAARDSGNDSIMPIM